MENMRARKPIRRRFNLQRIIINNKIMSYPPFDLPELFNYINNKPIYTLVFRFVRIFLSTVNRKFKIILQFVSLG